MGYLALLLPLLLPSLFADPQLLPHLLLLAPALPQTGALLLPAPALMGSLLLLPLVLLVVPPAEDQSLMLLLLSVQTEVLILLTFVQTELLLQLDRSRISLKVLPFL